MLEVNPHLRVTTQEVQILACAFVVIWYARYVGNTDVEKRCWGV